MVWGDTPHPGAAPSLLGLSSPGLQEEKPLQVVA